MVCLFQELSKLKRPGELLTVLRKRDDELGLMPAFIRALRETDQTKVLRVLGYEGLRTFLVLLVIHLAD